MSNEHVEVLRNLSEVCRAAIKAGDWKVDGACDPDSLLRHADAAIASLSAPQPPAEAQPVGGGEVVYQAKDETLGAWYDVAKARWDNYDSHLRRAVYTTPPSAPVGVPPALTPEQVHEMAPDGLSWDETGAWAMGYEACRQRALAQQPAAVECDCPIGQAEHASWCAISKTQDAQQGGA